MEFYWNSYLSSPEDSLSPARNSLSPAKNSLSPEKKIQQPTAVPYLAHNLKGLPPTHIVLAEFDPLRDEGKAFAEHLGPLKARHVTSNELRSFLVKRTKDLNNATYNRQLQAIRTFFNWAIRRRYLSMNPASSQHLQNLPEEEQPRATFTKKQVQKLLEVEIPTSRLDTLMTCNFLHNVDTNA